MGGGSTTHQVVLWVEVEVLTRWCCGWREYYSPGGAVGGGSITHQVVLLVEVVLLTRWCCGWR